MAASPWLWEEDGSIAIKSQPVSITYCSTLNCVLLTTTDNHVDIIDVNSGDIIRRELLLSGDKNVSSRLQCVFNASVGSLVITNGTKVGLRKDINGIYLLHTILQAPLQEIRDEEIIIEMTLSDMEHIVSGLQAAIKNAHEPQLSTMERVLKKVKDSIQKMQTKITEEDGKLQKWATCCVNIDGETIHSALTHSISNLQTLPVKGPQLSSTSALLSQISNLLPNYVGDQPDILTTKKKMWSEANRRKTFNNWPHKHYKWAVPETMAQAGFYHQSDRRTYPNSVDRAVCFTCNVGLVCWEPTDEPWSEHERHSPSCPFVRGECTENVPLSVTVATSPAQCHNNENEKIACLSVPSSVALMSTSTLTGNMVVWDIQDELQVRCRLQLVVDDKVLANDFEELSDLLDHHIDPPVDESTKEIIDEVAEMFLDGFKEGTSSKEPSINNKPSSSYHPIEVRCLGLLKNNQEVDLEEDSSGIQPLLSEAMLLAGMNVTTEQQDTTCKHLCLVVCEIPADKHKQCPSTNKVIDEKNKAKPVSYSTQLSFESEDEFYDPLFAGSMPHDVFPKITSPTKDGFAKIWGNKSEESTIKDGKIIQCLNLEQYLQCKNGGLYVRQILPYHNGSYVLLVVAEDTSDSNTLSSDLQTQIHNNETNGYSGQMSNLCENFDDQVPTSCEGNVDHELFANRYLMLYKTHKMKGRTLLEEKPIKVVSFDEETTLHSLILLPDDVEESFIATADEVIKPDYIAGITGQGSIVVLDGLSLDVVTSYTSADKVYSHVVFCSGLGSFCASTTDNNLEFLHLVKNTADAWQKSGNVNQNQVASNEKQIKDQSNELPSDNLTLPILKSLVAMTKFENLVPRYTAIVPVFWAEIQQEQQQRRHPQHLLQNAQGDASCHTRTWRLQKKGLVSGDQLFELMLPRPCYVGHVDVKFTMNKSMKSKNKVQVILSKPRSTTLRAKPTQSASAQQMKGDLICGPVDLSEDLKPYGEHGHVVLTSPVLLSSKVRTLFVIFKCKPKASGQDEKSPGGGRTGFSGLEEISITVRSLTVQYNAEVFDRYFGAMEFSSQLLDIACKTSDRDISGKQHEDLQWYALELMCWIAGITVHQPVSEGCLSSVLVENFPQLIQSCFLTATRSIAHKCSRLMVLCVSQLAPNDDSVKPCLLRALLNVLPSTLSCDSFGGLHWFFTLLTGLVSQTTLDLTGASCVELLIEIGNHLDEKLTDFDRLLRANFSLYGTPLDPMVFDVSNETLGLFASRRLSGDLLNPKNTTTKATMTTEIEEFDLMDYTLSKHNDQGVPKMEKLLSCASGILEVEPLAYICSSMSDGCKVDAGHGIQPLPPAHPVPPHHGMYTASPHPMVGQDGLLHGPMATLQDHVHQLKEHEKLLSKLQKQKMQLEEQHQELEELGGMFFSNHLDKFNDDPWFAGKKLSSPSPKVGAGFAAAVASSVNSYPAFGVQQLPPSLRNTIAQQRVITKTRTSFQLPVPKVLVIEKLQTGSRHFVVLDFGQNVRLTDIFIPSCPDLSSLVIDIWMDSEEKDLNRVTVSTDIGTKCLLLTDLLPPITCRYLKISLFALRGTLRTKLILGEYFGYPVSSEDEASDSEDMQRIHYLSLMYDDVFCQYGIACQRLESLLNCLEPAVLNVSKPPRDTKLLPGATNVRQAYTSCMNLQLRLNFLEHSIQRLERRHVKAIETPSTGDDIEALIEHASYSKLKSISDWLVYVLVSLFGIDEPPDEQGQQWYGEMTLGMCQDLFTTFCVKGTCSSRARVGALLLRMCGEQAWWGGFLAWVMQHFFSCNQSMVFSRERLFLLLSSMSQLSSLQFTVITSGLELLQSLLVPLSSTSAPTTEPFDSALLEWVTLYVSNLLDNFIDTTYDFPEKDGQACSQNGEKNTTQCKVTQESLTKRWDFIVPKKEDGSNENSKDSKKEMQKIMKQIAIRQNRLQVLHQQHMLNKAYHAESYNSSPSSWSPPSPSQITHWNKQFRLKAKKPLKDLKRLKRMMANSSNQTTQGNSTPRQIQKLHRDLCLPVMKGLLTVLLSRQGACNVDFFVLICKVLSCLKIVSYPAVILSDFATREQVDQLLRMCVKQQGVVHSNWSMGDHWIRHAATCLLQDLLTDMCMSTVTNNAVKTQETEISDNNDTSDASCLNDNLDAASDNDVLNESTDLTSIETGTEASIPEETGVDPLEGYVDMFPEVTPPDSNVYGCPIITIKDPAATTAKSPVISTSSSTSELSTAEDCRLEISVEMKAERELRRLAFVSRQRFLAGMDLKVGVKLSDFETRELIEDCDNDRVNKGVSHVFSQCIGQLVVEAFSGLYDIDSVLELCLLLDNCSKSCSFFITKESMESFLQGCSTIQGLSARSSSLAISWLRCMLRQTTSSNHEHHYPTAKTLVEDPRVVRVIGNILITYNYGNSGKKALGPYAVENLSSLLKSLMALQEHGISVHTLQDLFLGILLIVTKHNDDGKTTSSLMNRPLDMCIEFLEFFTRHFPTSPHVKSVAKYAMVFDSILSLVLVHLSSSNQVLCIGNSSKKRYTLAADTQGTSRDPGVEVTANQFTVLCLKILGKLLNIERSENTEQSMFDYVLNDKASMRRLMCCLNMCRGESFGLIEIGLNILSSDLSTIDGLANPTSIEDGVLKTFCLLYKHCSEKNLVISAILDFFVSDEDVQSGLDSAHAQLSELLLWVLLKLLDSDEMFRSFYENGGIEVICRKLSQASSRALHPMRGIVSTVVHQLGVKNVKNDSDKSLLAAAWLSDKQLVNFAPFASINCVQENGNPPDPLISSAAPHRRARTALWSYHFKNNEIWFSLDITLPNCIIVHEVLVQPHSTSLVMSASYVTLELSHAGSTVSKISPPLLSAALGNIRLQLTTPELASVVRVRFHRPRDSDTLGLTHIEVLGTSFYGPMPQVQALLQSQKMSLNWSRALDYCIRRSHDLSRAVLETLSGTSGILDVLLKILWSFPSSHLKTCIESTMVKLASHSTHHCTRLLTQLLYGGRLTKDSDGCLVGSLGVASGNSENELLYQLGILKDEQTWDRLKILCEWLLHVEKETKEQGKMASSNVMSKLRTVAAILWISNDDPGLCEKLQSLITEEKFRCLYKWCQSSTDVPILKLTLDYVICALCYVIPAYYTVPLSHVTVNTTVLDFSSLTSLAHASLSSPGAKSLLRSNVLQDIISEVEKLCTKSGKGSKKVAKETDMMATDLDKIRGVVEFLTLCLGQPVLKQWLGSEQGNYFWRSLLVFLIECHPRVSREYHARSTRVSVCPRLLANLQTAVMNFFKKCVSGHPTNQRHLARVLHELFALVTNDDTRTLTGFLRRLILELLLDGDHVVLAVTCSGEISHCMMTSLGNSSQSPLWHPRFGASNSCRLVRVGLNTTVDELTSLLVANPLRQLPKVATTNGSARKMSETLQDLMELLEISDISKAEAISLTTSAINVKHKRSGSHDNRKNDESSGKETKVQDSGGMEMTYLTCDDGPLAGIPLPRETTVAQIMECLLQHGQQLASVCIKLRVKSNMDQVTQVDIANNVVSKPVSSLLEVFSSLGGLALIAENLPPHFSVATSDGSTPVLATTPSYTPVVMTSSVPGHSLMGFTMFLRLPGYAHVLLEDQKSARIMLRLILGLEADDTEQGSTSSQSLPTLPFNILDKILKAEAITTPTGVVLRQTALDIGVVHLLLTSLGLLSHHEPRGTDERHEATVEALKVFSTSDDIRRSQATGCTNSKQYWAKGTGFGTGSTSSGWDIEQALVKQKNEEEHITWILQVLASFVCPLGVIINPDSNIDDITLSVPDEDITNILPTLPEILMNSCLIPTLASYLRNDSVLDMARHVPLYRALLSLVRCMAVSPNLVPLLHPPRSQTPTPNNGDLSSLCSLLTKMKLCVDTYGSRLKCSEKGKDTKADKTDPPVASTPTGTKQDEIENESLSLFIPDVQTTSMLVHKAVDHYRWEHLQNEGSHSESAGQGSGTGKDAMSTEERYSSVMMPLQFDTFHIVTEGADGKPSFSIPYHYSSSVKSATSSGQRTNAGRARRLAQEIASLSTSLPLSYNSSVFVRCDEERLDLMKVLITGPAETPYANGCFEFDVYFPPDYPSNPMHISFETTGNHRIRFNPNLYNDGKVCLSILNTWHGRPEEKWNSQTSSFLQVLVSIQSLILVPEPYFNEPGYERSRGTHSGTVNSREYDANIRQATVKWAMLEPLKKPCRCFKEVIERHFYLKKDEVLKQCDDWIRELEMWSKEKRTMRSITHHLESLRRHTTQLRDVISKLSDSCLETHDDDDDEDADDKGDNEDNQENNGDNQGNSGDDQGNSGDDQGNSGDDQGNSGDNQENNTDNQGNEDSKGNSEDNQGLNEDNQEYNGDNEGINGANEDCAEGSAKLDKSEGDT